jgi:hypothetical protein
METTSDLSVVTVGEAGPSFLGDQGDQAVDEFLPRAASTPAKKNKEKKICPDCGNLFAHQGAVVELTSKINANVSKIPNKYINIF